MNILSLDVEALGPCPPYQLRQIGLVLLNPEGEELDRLERNVLPEGPIHPEYQSFWDLPKNADTFRSFDKDAISLYWTGVDVARFIGKCSAKGPFELVAAPSSYDVAFLCWALCQARCDKVFFVGADVRSYLQGWAGVDHHETSNKFWTHQLENKHTAAADALEQGRFFAAMKRARKAGEHPPMLVKGFQPPTTAE